MSMQGIDISSWQSGINVGRGGVPCDFVIMKATQGTTYTNPDCNRAYQQAKAAGKCLGVYHYVSGVGAVAEADFFVNSVRGYVGEAMLVIDWEKDENPQFGNSGYLSQLVAHVIARTGVRPVLYGMQSDYATLSAVGKQHNCGLWVAQYASMNPTGYQDKPWNEGAYPCLMRQYSSAGRLLGWAGNLDLNKFYGDRNLWMSYANPNRTNNTQGDDDMVSQADMEKIAKLTADRVWLHKLPSGAVARDMVSPACANAFWMRDHGIPNVMNRITVCETKITAMEAAMDALAKSVGANPDDIAKIVEDAVKGKLNAIDIQITTTAKE